MTTTTTNIAYKVRGLAAERRLTQEQLASVLGISRTSVVSRLNGRIAFTAPEMYDLANAMNVPIERLFPSTIA